MPLKKNEVVPYTVLYMLQYLIRAPPTEFSYGNRYNRRKKHYEKHILLLPKIIFLVPVRVVYTIIIYNEFRQTYIKSYTCKLSTGEYTIRHSLGMWCMWCPTNSVNLATVASAKLSHLLYLQQPVYG